MVTISPASIPVGMLGAKYAVQFEAMGGRLPYTWCAADLPDGFVFTPQGVLSGASFLAVSQTVFISATDSNNPPQQASLYLQLIIDNSPTPPPPPPPPLLISPVNQLFHGRVQGLYGPITMTFQLSAETGSFPLSWSISKCPYTIDNEGLVSADVSTRFNGPFTVTLHDSEGRSAQIQINSWVRVEPYPPYSRNYFAHYTSTGNS